MKGVVQREEKEGRREREKCQWLRLFFPILFVASCPLYDGGPGIVSAGKQTANASPTIAAVVYISLVHFTFGTTGVVPNVK